MMVGHINAGKRLGEYGKGLYAAHKLRARHDALAAEMERRGYKHSSPLPEFDERPRGYVDRNRAYRELLRRCPACKQAYTLFLQGADPWIS